MSIEFLKVFCKMKTTAGAFTLVSCEGGLFWLLARDRAKESFKVSTLCEQHENISSTRKPGGTPDKTSLARRERRFKKPDAHYKAVTKAEYRKYAHYSFSYPEYLHDARCNSGRRGDLNSGLKYIPCSVSENKG